VLLECEEELVNQNLIPFQLKTEGLAVDVIKRNSARPYVRVKEMLILFDHQSHAWNNVA